MGTSVGRHFSSNALNAATSAILHGAVGTMAGRLFGRRASVLVLLLTLSRVPCAFAMDSFSSPNASIAHTSIFGSDAQVEFHTIHLRFNNIKLMRKKSNGCNFNLIQFRRAILQMVDPAT